MKDAERAGPFPAEAGNGGYGGKSQVSFCGVIILPGKDRDQIVGKLVQVSERYERGSVLLSSNLPFSKWEHIFKDPMTTAAAIDRLIHLAT